MRKTGASPGSAEEKSEIEVDSASAKVSPRGPATIWKPQQEQQSLSQFASPLLSVFSKATWFDDGGCNFEQAGHIGAAMLAIARAHIASDATSLRRVSPCLLIGGSILSRSADPCSHFVRALGGMGK